MARLNYIQIDAISICVINLELSYGAMIRVHVSSTRTPYTLIPPTDVLTAVLTFPSIAWYNGENLARNCARRNQCIYVDNVTSNTLLKRIVLS